MHILFAIVILIGLYVLYSNMSCKESYSAIFKVGNRLPPGFRQTQCNYQYADCLNSVKEGVHTKDYCDRLYFMCSKAAQMSPY